MSDMRWLSQARRRPVNGQTHLFSDRTLATTDQPSGAAAPAGLADALLHWCSIYAVTFRINRTHF
jgi:hypothetical protein